VPYARKVDTLRFKAPSNRERVDWISTLARAKRECVAARAAAGQGAAPRPNNNMYTHHSREYSRDSAGHGHGHQRFGSVQTSSVYSTGSGGSYY